MKKTTDHSKHKTYAVGGKTGMHKNTSAGPQKPGQSASEGRSGARFAEGGKTKMFGKQTAKHCSPA